MDYIKEFSADSPVFIMTSLDTHFQTLESLENNNYYDYPKNLITVIKQHRMPALIDKNANFCLEEDKLQLLLKPHGHGDVHNMIYLNNL